MKLVQHPHVVRLYEVIDTPSKLYLVLEFADGGDMYDHIMKHEGGLGEEQARTYFRQIVTAIQVRQSPSGASVAGWKRRGKALSFFHAFTLHDKGPERKRSQ